MITRRLGLVALAAAFTGRAQAAGGPMRHGRSATTSDAVPPPPSAPASTSAPSPLDPAVAGKPGLRAKLETMALPERYDEPLGIGLENWPYPAPVHWKDCEAGGQKLRMAYMDVAPTTTSRNRTVVLLHGKNYDSSYWSEVIKDLTGAGYRVIVPDQIGFNKSSKPDLTYSLDLLSSLTINLLAGQQIGKFSVIGHAFGGMLAIRLAASHPERIDRLVLEAPVGLVDYRRYVPPQSTEALVAAERRRTVSSYRAFLRTALPVLPAAALEPLVEWRMRVAQSGEYERFCKAAALTYEMIYREPVRSQVDDIVAPTLFIVGDKDVSAPMKRFAAPMVAAKMPGVPAAAAEAAKSMKSGTYLSVPGVGHAPHLEAPDVFRKAVLAFLAG